MSVQYKRVGGKIDICDKELNNIVDVKTSKSQEILLKPFKFHEEQVRYYMAMMDSDEGQIIYQMNNFGKYLPFPIYMTTEQRKEQLLKLEAEAKSLQQAIKAGDPSLVKGIFNDNEINWMCKKCQYLQRSKDVLFVVIPHHPRKKQDGVCMNTGMVTLGIQYVRNVMLG